jgi:hypothetical protein
MERIKQEMLSRLAGMSLKVKTKNVTTENKGCARPAAMFIAFIVVIAVVALKTLSA